MKFAILATIPLVSVRGFSPANEPGDATAGKQFYALEKSVRRFATMPLEKLPFDDARQAATLLLEIAPRFRSNLAYGNALHHANLVLGLIHLGAGHLREAEECLARAGATPGSPQLDSFGPNMRLASELLQRGERDAVLSYLDQVQVFWKDPPELQHAGTLAVWRAEILAGKTPSFGGNLGY